MAGSPTIASLFAQRIVVGVGELGVSNNSAITLSTYALGSCIGLAAYDSVAKVGGILHLMLPESTLAPDKAADRPAMFADTGLPLFFRSMTGLRAVPSRLRLFIAGGANVMGAGSDNFKIGERNLKATSAWLAQNGFTISHSDCGGTVNRTLHLEIATGAIKLKSPIANDSFLLAA